MQRLGKIDFDQGEYGASLETMSRVVQIRELNKTRDVDYVNSLYMIGNIHKLQNNDKLAKQYWGRAYETFQDLGLAEEKPKVGAVLEKLQDKKQGCCETFQKGAKDIAKKLTCNNKVSEEVVQGSAGVASTPTSKKRTARWAKTIKEIILTV